MTKSKTLFVISTSESDNHPAIFLLQVRMETVQVLVVERFLFARLSCRRSLTYIFNLRIEQNVFPAEFKKIQSYSFTPN